MPMNTNTTTRGLQILTLTGLRFDANLGIGHGGPSGEVPDQTAQPFATG